MPHSLPRSSWSPEIVVLVDQLRAARPGLVVDVQSPTREERDDLPVADDYRELVIGSTGLERYVIPLHGGEDAFEVWRVSLADMPGAGELLGSHTSLYAAGQAAVAAADEPTAVNDPATAVGGRGTGLDGRAGRVQTAVSNVWRSDMSAAAELQAQVRAAETDGGGEMPGPLRADEVDLLAQVDPDTARTVQRVGGRTGGGRADWTHRRPERAAAQPVPGRQLGRTVDGSD